jgi:probable rRNA maturation factor
MDESMPDCDTRKKKKLQKRSWSEGPHGSPWTIYVRKESGLTSPLSVSILRRAVRQTLFHDSYRGRCSVSLVLVSDRTITALNLKFRKLARATDVLSFPSGSIDPADRLTHLGDIAISLPRAAEQARARHKPPSQEVLLLAIHGVLHLLGHDHDTPAGKSRMWRAQKEILKELPT